MLNIVDLAAFRRFLKLAAAGASAGALLENYVVSEVVRSYRHRGLEPPLYFWRDKEKREVDLLLAEDGKLFPIEVKLSASPSNRDLKGFRALRSFGASLGPGAVISMVDQPFPITENVEALPVDALF